MSIFFNSSFYLQNNPDVLQAVANGAFPDAESHFNEFGWREGRSPNPNFDVNFYLINNPDVLAAGVNPLTHFIQFGAAEGRIPSADFVSPAQFDSEAYAAANPDLADAGLTTPAELFAHFVTFGFSEGRPGVQTIDGAPIVIGVPGGAAGQTFNLTPQVDSPEATDANDIFNAVVSTTAGQTTLNVADVIDGKGGTDTFNIILEGGGSAIPSATITNVENFFLREAGSGANQDFTNVSGAEQIWSSKSSADLNVVGIQNAVALGIKDTNRDYNAMFDSGVIGKDAGLTVALIGAGKSTDRAEYTVDAAGGQFSSLSVLAAGGSSFTQVNGKGGGDFALNTVNVTGAGKVDISAGTNAVFTNVKTVDAGTNTGGVTLDLSGNTKDVSVTGGKGDDRFVIDNFNKNDVVDGGSGNDTLSITLGDAASLGTAAKVSNIEVLELRDAVAVPTTINAALFGVEDIVFKGATNDNLTVSNLASEAMLTFNGAGDATKSVSLDVQGAIAGTEDVLNIMNGAAATIGTVVAGGVETVNFTAGTNNFTVQGLDSAQLSTITIGGKGDFTLTSAPTASPLSTVDASGASGAVNVNASNSTTDVTFSGGSGANTFTGGTGNDVFTGGAKDDVIVTGAGNDTVNATEGKDTVFLTATTGNDVVIYTNANQSTTAAAGRDTIFNFDTAADLLRFDGLSTVGTASYVGAAGFSGGAANTELRMAGNQLQIDLDGNGAADMAITLVGVTAGDFGAANFTFA